MKSLKNLLRIRLLSSWLEENPSKLCIGLILIIVFSGLTGHDPWKPDEAHIFGVTLGVVKNGEWVIPNLATEPYLKYPNFVYVSSAVSSFIFSPLFPLHDAARLSTGIWMIIVFVFTALAAKELWGGKRIWLSPLILAGCAGLLVRSHQLIPHIIF